MVDDKAAEFGGARKDLSSQQQSRVSHLLSDKKAFLFSCFALSQRLVVWVGRLCQVGCLRMGIGQLFLEQHFEEAVQILA